MARKNKMQATMAQWSYDNEKWNKKILGLKKSVDDLNDTLSKKKKK